MEWDPEFEAVFTEVLQSKVGRFKLIAFVAGADRHMCFFLALADYMISRPPPIYNSDTPAWLIPELHVTSTPAQKLGLYLKDLLPRLRGGAASFSKVAVVVTIAGRRERSRRAARRLQHARQVDAGRAHCARHGP